MDMLTDAGASANIIATIKSQMDTSTTNALSASSIETMLSKAGVGTELIQTIKTQISGQVEAQLPDDIRLLNEIAGNTWITVSILNTMLENQKRVSTGYTPLEGSFELQGANTDFPFIKGYAAQHGGVFEGPTSGYPMTLHGREAVIPMHRGGDIPVKIQGGNDDEVVGLLRELIYELKQKDTSPKITVAMDKRKLMRDTAKYVNERMERRVLGE
jgi:hypothetical protein